ncbi:MAG: glutamine-synthetase adenylyltransferase [Persephonella sp.]|nr:MAG: glutamine-synthetase adenylyltransferase [Persephonella sp.]
MSIAKFELLKKDFLNSLSPDKLNLLKDLSDYSKCISDFIFRHTDQLDYIYNELEKDLYGRERLIKEALNLLNIHSDNQFITELTIFKLKHFSRIVAKDIYKKEEFEKLTEEYSYLADATVEVAYRRAYKKWEKIYGEPKEKLTGKVAAGTVIALGKYGGLDLNYHSDIDIMYIYSDDGRTEKGHTNREFFTNLFQTLTSYLSKRNLEGITWIVDLDLRPEGKKGFIAYPLPFIEHYYWSFGRTWERHMLIKARYGGGDEDLFKNFQEIITPFVYRKHTGTEVFEEIGELKRLIEIDAEKKIKNGFDVKRGKGGIREVEFTTQILQLLYGGRDKDLRENKTLKALQKIVEKGYLDRKKGKILKEGYIFLRKIENVIQIENCVQTHILKFDEVEKIAKKLGFKDKREFLDKLNFYRDNINEIFNNLLPETDVKLSPIQRYILTKHYEEEAKDYLKRIGFKSPYWALNIFKDVFFSKQYVELSSKYKEILFEFLPVLEEELKKFEDREDFLLNVSKILIDGGLLILFAYSLEQNKKLADFILKVAKLSDYISSLLAKDKEIADWFLNFNESLTEKVDFEREFIKLREKYNCIDSLKKLKKYTEVFSTVNYLSEIEKSNPKKNLKNLNSSLSNLADFILEKLYQYYEGKEFCIYALGKLGSREMNIGSDLDLIFVMKDEKSKSRFYDIPLKIIKSLTSYSKEGILYQIDLRLRPFGKKGELAPSLSFYKNYFEKEAKSWERLAWSKSRFITGDKSTKDEMDRVIKEFVFEKPINTDFIEDILDMRLKLEGLTRESSNEIDIKLGKGGLTDLEFLAQLKIIKDRLNETNILNVIDKYFSDLLKDYLFLREIEARLRIIKGIGISKISLNSPYFYRIAHSFNKSERELWKDILNTKNRIRDKFLRRIKDFCR